MYIIQTNVKICVSTVPYLAIRNSFPTCICNMACINKKILYTMIPIQDSLFT